MSKSNLKNIVEAALMAAAKPLSLDQLIALFAEHEVPDRVAVRAILEQLETEYAERGIEIKRIGDGYRLQVRQSYGEWIGRLWDERPPRYSRALLETLAIIAYRQPVTRGEIEDIRGVGTSSTIMKTLQEREWVRVVGHRDVPGKPALFGTTRTFLEYFNLKGLDQLPSLAEIRDIDSINVELELDDPDKALPSHLELADIGDLGQVEESEELTEAIVATSEGDSEDEPLSVH